MLQAANRSAIGSKGFPMTYLECAGRHKHWQSACSAAHRLHLAILWLCGQSMTWVRYADFELHSCRPGSAAGRAVLSAWGIGRDEVAEARERLSELAAGYEGGSEDDSSDCAEF